MSDTALTCGALLGLALTVALVAPAVGDAARPTPARGLTLVVDWKAKVSIRQAPGSRTLAVAKWKTPFGSVRRLQVVARRGNWFAVESDVLGNGIVGFENVGGQIDDVTGKRVTFAAFPWRWTQGDGCIVRLVAIVDPTGEYRIETGDGD